MNPKLKQKLDELIKEMIYVPEVARMIVFSDLKRAYCEKCGGERGNGESCICNTD